MTRIEVLMLSGIVGLVGWIGWGVYQDHQRRQPENLVPYQRNAARTSAAINGRLTDAVGKQLAEVGVTGGDVEPEVRMRGGGFYSKHCMDRDEMHDNDCYVERYVVTVGQEKFELREKGDVATYNWDLTDGTLGSGYWLRYSVEDGEVKAWYPPHWEDMMSADEGYELIRKAIAHDLAVVERITSWQQGRGDAVELSQQ